jgi:hypothetical protein
MAKPTGKIRYKYLGDAPWLMDSQAGSGAIWKGKDDIQAIPDYCAETFEAVYGPYFQRLDPLVDVPDEVASRRVPQGTPYSHLTVQQIREEYTRRAGLKPNAKLSAESMINTLMDTDALEQGQIFQDETEADISARRAG